MKKYYEVKIELVSLQTQDVVTASGFMGETDGEGFGNPNASTNNIGNF